MNKPKIFLTAALIIAALGCVGNKKTASEGVMTMTTNDHEVRIELQGSGTAMIDWGDGSENETIELWYISEYDVGDKPWTSRTFTDATPRTITIIGDNITDLICDHNQLTALDVSRNPLLKYLSCWQNQLTELNVSKNLALTKLYCGNNDLTTLDVSRNNALTVLHCSLNGLNTLDVRNSTLTELLCNSNQLTILDISRNTTLEILFCGDNQLTALDVSKNTALKILNCGDNHLTALNVSRNTALYELKCFDNKLTADALNTLFASLHDNEIVIYEELSGGERTVQKSINIGDNPGATNCNPNIATDKGWKVEGFEGAVDYTKIYQPLIEDLKSENEGVTIYYAIFDIDNNAIPELLIKIAYNEYNIFFSHIYTIKDGEPIFLFEPPYSRYGSSVILRNGLIDATAGDYAIYKISEDGFSVVRIAKSEPYDYPDEASLAEAKWRHFINNSVVEYDFYVQYLKEQGYTVSGENIEADIDWKELTL